jgi:hypothetical protein
MKIGRVKAVAKFVHQNKVKDPLVIVGHRGLGKSQTFLDIGKELGVPIEILRIGSKNDVGDLLGMPYVTDERETRYAAPGWFNNLINGGILVLDEVNRAKPSMHDAIMQLLDSRRLDVYQLPETVTIIAIMNPCTEGYDVAEFDEAMVDRGVYIKATSDGDECLAYMLNHEEFVGELTDLVALSKDQLEIGNGFDLPQKKFTPRGVRQLNNYWPVVQAFPDIADEIVLGCVGTAGFSAYNNRRILKDIPTAEQYFKDPASVELSKIEKIHMIVFITRVMGFLKSKKASADLQAKFTGLCSGLSEQMLMYIARVSMENQWLNKFIEATNKKLNDSSIKLAGILASAS